MADFLSTLEVVQADIIAIQEPWENPYNDTKYHPLKQTHELLFPSKAESTPRQIDNAVEQLIDIVQRGVEESTPWANPSPQPPEADISDLQRTGSTTTNNRQIPFPPVTI
jgi:hypothetical protein